MVKKGEKKSKQSDTNSPRQTVEKCSICGNTENIVAYWTEARKPLCDECWISLADSEETW